MSSVGNEELLREVSAALSDWTPTRSYSQESEFQDEMEEYLTARLNADGSESILSARNVLVDRTHGQLECDVVVSDAIGIIVKQNPTASQFETLQQLIPEYRKTYTHVIIIACGTFDKNGWEQLKEAFKTQTGISPTPANTPVLFMHREEATYGKGDSAENYRETETQDTGEHVLVRLKKKLVRGVQSVRSTHNDTK